jgi:predicted alpha-1,2-mannosidase
LIQPNNIADVDGSYQDSKGLIKKADNNAYYSTFSCWDTYRAAHPFYTLVMPDKVDGLVSSLITQAEDLGFIPIWGLWGKDNYCMVANHGVSIIAEAYHKGFRGFDAERAFQAIKNTETKSHKLKSNWEIYMRYGYFPTDSIEAESVSSTLETVYDDYAAWDMATLMGKKEDAAYFGKRKEFYKNLFDPETKFMRPRRTDGTWKSPFDPAGLAHAESSGGDYTEGNAWQYTWHVQHDVPGLIKLMGGKKAFTDKLDIFFTTKLESTLSDVTGLIGQYAHGNEPSHHVAYLYALAGKPERTQELVREVFDTQYSPRPDGLCGNDDCGQMSAWYMLSAMGFYPVDPVSAKYVFGAPQMPKFVMHLQNGKTFTIEAQNLSKENLHVDKIYLNGKVYKKNYIEHSDIIKGGKLVFVMKK